MPHIQAILIRILLIDMREYLEKLSRFIEYGFDSFLEESKEIEEGLNEVELKEFREITDYDRKLYEMIFPRILFNSSVVSIYSILESEIGSIADMIKKNKKEKFSLADIKRADYLQSAQKYILQLSGLDICKYRNWEFVKDLQNIRNIIVHSNGKLLSKKDIQLAKKYKIIYTSGSLKEIAVTHRYATQSIDTLIDFFNVTIADLNDGGHLF